MTRQITLAILLTVWTMQLLGAAAAYMVTRSLLLADLDDALVEQALAKPGLAAAARWRGSPTALPEGERYVIQTGPAGRKIRVAGGSSDAPAPELVAATFSTSPDGLPQRTVTVRAWRAAGATAEPPTPVLVTYTGSAQTFRRLLNRLAMALGACVIAGGLVAAAISRRVSRRALRPLRDTATAIETIDERRLDQRIDASNLPPELVPMVKRLNAMLARLEQAFHLRRQFLADASHELRTPVAALVTGVEVALSRARPAEAYRASLQNALADARHLRRLVERLMEQVRSEEFNHEEPARDVDVSAMLDACADVAAALGAPRQIQVQRAYPAALHLATQPARLRSILQNLLGNAVYHNRPGGRVTLSAGDDAGALRVEVADTGPGIAPEQLPHLFEPFYRGDAAHRADDDEHLGLGLFLVQSHLRAIGGTCSVSSELGRGSRFAIVVPNAKTDQSAASAADAPISAEPALHDRARDHLAPEGGRQTALMCSSCPPVKVMSSTCEG